MEKKTIIENEFVSKVVTEGLTREAYLHNALCIASGTGYFTSGERICINQERGYLLSLSGEELLNVYQIPDYLEIKIRRLFE